MTLAEHVQECLFAVPRAEVRAAAATSLYLETREGVRKLLQLLHYTQF